MTVGRVAGVLLLAAVLGIGGRVTAESKPGAAGLRDRLLKGAPTDFGVTPDGNVWGVLMETGYPEAAVTLVSLADGTASIYTSLGGGVLGGGEHASVGAAAKRFVRRARDFAAALPAVSSFPPPAEGRTTFYLLTTNGVLRADAAEGDLGGGKHALSPLFYAGHEVITEIREASEARGR